MERCDAEQAATLVQCTRYRLFPGELEVMNSLLELVEWINGVGAAKFGASAIAATSFPLGKSNDLLVGSPGGDCVCLGVLVPL